MIRVVHQLRGRARFEVPGLRGSRVLALLLDRELPRSPAINSVSASHVTGKILVLFAENETPAAIAALIDKILEKLPEILSGEAPCGRTGSDSSAPSRDFTSRSTEGSRLSGVEPWVCPALDEVGVPWHTMEPDGVAHYFQSSLSTGLPEPSVGENRAKFGANPLPGMAARSFFRIMQNQVSSLPVALIGIAAGLSAMTGAVAEGLLALGVALSNCVVGSVTEHQAERSLKITREAVDLRAKVLREGRVEEIAFDQVVAGDLVELQPGARVPADARLVRTESLALDESSLTGESLPVSKSALALPHGDIPLTERFNMVYRGTLVVEGTGWAVVVATGRQTVLGKLQCFLGEVFPPEALMARDLKSIAELIIKVGVGGCGVLAVVSLLRGHGLLRIAGDSISFLAGSIPSGLSTLAVSAFALGHRDLRGRRILARRLRALGNLASVQVVCLDKTGTLTHNRMTVTEISAGGKHVRVEGNEFMATDAGISPLSDPDIARLIELSALCNEAHAIEVEDRKSLEGSSTERALIDLAHRAGMDPAALLEMYPIIHIAHRSEEHHFMATVHRSAEAGQVAAMKGAPLDVLDRCSHFTRNGETLPLGDDERHAMEIENLKMAGKGLRVLGVAYRPDPAVSQYTESFPGTGSQPSAVIHGEWENGEATSSTESSLAGDVVRKPFLDEPWISPDEPDFVWVGLVALADPLRKEAGPLIKALHGAGIKTAVITGDQSFTARHIGEELRLSGDAPLRILDASDLRSLDPAAMKSIATQAHIFARLNPTQKLQIVQAYQSAGMSVIMVGDGLNDALALKVADVGIAMGRAGTGLAQRSADLVLEDDNLESVMFAISTGRTFFRNMRRSVRFLLTANHVDVLMALSERSGLMGQGHSMWQSLWTNLMCLSLTLEPPGASFADEGPVDPEEGLIRPRDLEDTFLDAADVMTGAGAAGCYGVARYGTGSEASRLFAHSASINQIVYGVKCGETNGEPPGERPSNPFLQMVLLGAVGSRLLALLLPGIGKPLGELASRALDALIVGASGLLSLELLRTDEKARPQPERAGVDHPLGLL